MHYSLLVVFLAVNKLILPMRTVLTRILHFLSAAYVLLFVAAPSLMAHPSHNHLLYPHTTFGLKGGLRGTVKLEGRPEGQMTTRLKIQLYQPGKTVPFHIEDIYASNQGEFSIDDIIPGNYVLTIKNMHTLQLAAAITIAPGTETVINFKKPLLEGDANDDNQIDEADFALLSKAFGTLQGGKGYNSVTDFNADNTVSVLDFSLLAGNYQTKGYQVHENSYTELSAMATADLYLLIVNKVFFRRYYASK